MNKLLSLVNEHYHINASNIKKISENTFLIDKIYLLKKSNKGIEKVNNYLESTKLENILLPFATVNGDKTFEHNNNFYFLTKFIYDVKYPKERKIFDLKNELYKIHKLTETDRKVNRKKIYKKLYKIYQRLDYKFKLLEAFIRGIESKEHISEFEYIILYEYHIFLNVKKTLYNLQKKIHSYIDEEISLKYCLIHGNPSLDHLVVDGNKYLISFERSIMGIPSIDIARFYILNEEIDVDFKHIITNWLNEYNHEFYFLYFKFIVLYTYVLWLDLDSDNYYIIFDKLRIIVKKIEKFNKIISDSSIINNQSNFGFNK